jgi:NTE family protein
VASEASFSAANRDNSGGVVGTRAIVLGGGGVTGIAWETGVLNGLADAGVDLRADAVIGTSAGAFVGAVLAGGGDLAAAFDAQHRPAPDETSVRLPRAVLAAWIWVYLRGFRNPERIGAGFGAVADRRRPLVNASDRRRTVQARLGPQEWPATLRVTAIDLESGQLRAFERSDGYPLADAVSASGAVPGISPPVDLGGRRWIDGGMVSSTNTRLAEDFDEVLVIAPLAQNHGGLPSVQQEVERLDGPRAVHLIVPDDSSKAAIGSNIYDPSRRPEAADAGREQGVSAGAPIARQQQ